MKNLVIVRGAGDLASGIITKFHNCGYKVLALECDEPTAVRRFVSFSEAVWNRETKVEGINAVYSDSREDVYHQLDKGHVVVAKDPQGKFIEALKPKVVIDAIIAKKNITTTNSMAPVVIGVGPGHVVGVHCHAAVESSRGHNLGRVYYNGSPEPNTGIPGSVGGVSKERVIYSSEKGVLEVVKDITDKVSPGDVIAKIGDTDVTTAIGGIVRGMLRHGTLVQKGMKIADIDPRVNQLENCYKISDKARCIAGGVLEAVMSLERKVC